jgi:pyruvyltransferase
MSSFRQSRAWKLAKAVALDPTRRVSARIAGHGRVPLTWCLGTNWGDALSPVLVGLLAGKSVVHLEGLHHDRYLAIGSILGGANSRAEVWGSGFIREDENVLERPRAIHAVRGPLSRDSLTRQGIDCPEVYGDPALLLPRFLDPAPAKKQEIGIIPHYIDKGHPWIRQRKNDSNVQVIDVDSGIEDFVSAVTSSQIILSSSLHGLICADAYGIPCAWIRLSDDIVGGEFKFRDYHLSIGAQDSSPVTVSENKSLAKVTSSATLRELRIDLRKLMLACPFLSVELRKEVEDREPASCGLPWSFLSRRFHLQGPRS